MFVNLTLLIHNYVTLPLYVNYYLCYLPVMPTIGTTPNPTGGHDNISTKSGTIVYDWKLMAQFCLRKEKNVKHYRRPWQNFSRSNKNETSPTIKYGVLLLSRFSFFYPHQSPTDANRSPSRPHKNASTHRHVCYCLPSLRPPKPTPLATAPPSSICMFVNLTLPIHFSATLPLFVNFYLC